MLRCTDASDESTNGTGPEIGRRAMGRISPNRFFVDQAIEGLCRGHGPPPGHQSNVVVDTPGAEVIRIMHRIPELVHEMTAKKTKNLARQPTKTTDHFWTRWPGITLINFSLAISQDGTAFPFAGGVSSRSQPDRR